MAISQPQQTASSVSTANTICCFILWEGRKITFLLLLSGMPHCVRPAFLCPGSLELSYPWSNFYPVQVLEHVVHLTRLTTVSARLEDRNSRSLSELLRTGCGGKHFGPGHRKNFQQVSALFLYGCHSYGIRRDRDTLQLQLCKLYLCYNLKCYCS